MHVSPFNLGNTGGNTDDNARLCKKRIAHSFLNKFAQHFCGYVKIRNNAVLERTHGCYRAGSAADHFLGLVSNGDHFAGSCTDIDGNNGRLPDNNALALDKDKRVGRSEVDSYIL